MEENQQKKEREISRKLESRFMGRTLVYLEETDSTNIQAKLLAEKGASEGTLVVAGAQSAGKGRRGRNWSSPKGTGIFMTFLLRPPVNPAQASMITLAAALGVRKAIKKVTGLETQIKWPNDIVWEGKKLCGILTEMGLDRERIGYVVVGIGINANMETFPPEIEKTACSLRQALGRPVPRESLVAETCNSFEQYYEAYLRTGDLSALQEEYNGCLVNCGQMVRILRPEKPESEYRAWAIGINEKGELLVRRPDGKLEAVVSGEVSVRGVYGYV